MNDPQITTGTRDIYMIRIKDYMAWAKEEKNISSGKILDFFQENYARLPKVTEYISFRKRNCSSESGFGGSASTQSVCAFQYLCKVIT